jgi:hypothetical protein
MSSNIIKVFTMFLDLMLNSHFDINLIDLNIPTKGITKLSFLLLAYEVMGKHFTLKVIFVFCLKDAY